MTSRAQLGRYGGRSSAGRAFGCGPKGRGFEPLRPPIEQNARPSAGLFCAMAAKQARRLAFGVRKGSPMIMSPPRADEKSGSLHRFCKNRTPIGTQIRNKELVP